MHNKTERRDVFWHISKSCFDSGSMRCLSGWSFQSTRYSTMFRMTADLHMQSQWPMLSIHCLNHVYINIPQTTHGQTKCTHMALCLWLGHMQDGVVFCVGIPGRHAGGSGLGTKAKDTDLCFTQTYFHCTVKGTNAVSAATFPCYPVSRCQSQLQCV